MLVEASVQTRMIARTIGLTCLVTTLAVAVSACSSPSSPSATTTTTTPTTTTDVLLGTVVAPVDGVLQSSFNTFVIAQGGGALTVTLTSAVETLPDKTLLTTVTMGLGIGTVANGTCTLLTNAFTTAQAGSSPQLQGSSVAAGSYCVQLSDVSS